MNKNERNKRTDFLAIPHNNFPLVDASIDHFWRCGMTQSFLTLLNAPRNDLHSIEYLLSYNSPIKAYKPSSSVSERYQFISTESILLSLKDKGFGVSSYMCSGKRYQPRDHAKHIVRLSRYADLGKPERPEIIITNSHDKTSAFSITAGFYRLICANGLVAMSEDVGFKAYHNNKASNIVDAAFHVINQASNMMPVVDKMKSILLDDDEKIKFADDALMIKNNKKNWSFLDSSRLVNSIRRFEDKDNSLWTVFNVVQENIIRGGIRLSGKRSQNIKSINENLRINKALWQLAVAYV